MDGFTQFFEEFGVLLSVIVSLAALGTVTWKGGALSEKVKKNEASIGTLQSSTSTIEKDLAYITGKIDEALENKTKGRFSVRNSPIKLNDEGQRILSESGIDGIVDGHFDEIVEIVELSKPVNAYQVQEATFDATKEVLGSTEELVNEIEQAAFMTGCSPRDIMFVGGLYIRDRVLEKLDCLPGDIDKHDPQADTPKSKKRK